MKKLSILSVLAVAGIALASAPAMAEHTGDHKGKGKMFEKLDTNSDGVVTQEEFLNAHKERFTKMDTNSDGKVTKDEADAATAKWREEMQARKKARAEKKTEAPVKSETPAAE